MIFMTTLMTFFRRLFYLVFMIASATEMNYTLLQVAMSCHHVMLSFYVMSLTHHFMSYHHVMLSCCVMSCCVMS
jgi:hypothetical protein